MNNLDMLKKQHTEIRDIMKAIEVAALKELESNAEFIARNINILSGKLKMHLMSEDRFLYPSLEKSANKVIKTTAQQYNQEMGGLAKEFLVFVEQYNIPSKILAGKSTFSHDVKRVFKIIKERVNREDQHLYPLLEKNR